jgi:hypothetical protein
MKSFAIFVLYFFLGIFLIFSYKKIIQIINSQQLKTPVATSLFSLENAPSESLRGTVVSLLGDVQWQSRIATQPAKIIKPMQIQQGEKLVTNDNGQAFIVISKTIEITMSPKTEINFIQTLPTNILIEQNSGKSDYINLNNNSFSVRSLNLLIKINQGEVSLSVNEKLPYITADVKSGSVTIGYNDINFITQTLNIASGKRLLFRTDTKKVSILSLQ